MKRKILSMVLTLCLLLSMFPALVPGASAEEKDEPYIVDELPELEPEEEIKAIADEPIAEPLDGDGSTVVNNSVEINDATSGNCGEEGDNITWEFDSDTGRLTITGSGRMRTYGDDSYVPWNRYRSQILSVAIYGDITYFSNHLFYPYYYKNIEAVYTRDISEWIGIEFSGWGSNPLSVGAKLFVGEEQLADLVIPEGINQINAYAFSGCKGLKTVSIPSSVKSICAYAFMNCHDITTVTLADGIEIIEEGVFRSCDSLLGIYLPNSVVEIGQYVFDDCYSLESVRLSDNISEIPFEAFYSCKALKKVDIPGNVTRIGGEAFCICYALTEIIIPPSVLEIGFNAFSTGGTEQVDIYIEDLSAWSRINFENKYSYPLYMHNATLYLNGEDFDELTIPGDITEVKDYAFIDGRFKVTLHDGITKIGDKAFYDCQYNDEIVLPSTLKEIGNFAFGGMGHVSEVYIPASVEKIGYAPFPGRWGLTNINVDPENENYCSVDGILYTKDMSQLIQYPSGKEEVDYYVPKTVNTIGWDVFGSNCLKKVENIYFSTDAPSVIASGHSFGVIYRFYDATYTATFYDQSFPDDVTLYYIPGTTGWTDSDAYDADAGTWNGYKLDTWDGTGESNVIASGYCGGEGDGTNLTWTLTDDGTLTISGTGAMADFGYEYDYENNEWIFTVPWTSYVDSLKTLVIESGVTTIGNNAFKDCSGFTGDLVIPDGVTTIGDSAFSNCSGFTGELNIPDTVTSIGAWAFSECRGFTGKLSLHSGVTNIGEAAFQMCEGLTGELVIPDSLTSIKDFVFSWCGFTGELVIPSSVTSIGECAFQNCSGFTGELVIPSSVTSIGDSAFHSCSGFTGTLVIPSTVTEIESSPFSGTSGITWIEVESANPNYASKDGILYDKDFSIVIQAPGGLSGELNIPDSVTTIGKSAFYFCKNLTGDLVIPNGVTSIGDGAFNNCSSFTGSLVIPAGVTRIESLAFAYCSGFSGDLVIPSGVSSIGILAFDGCTGLSGDVYFEGNAPTVTAASEVFHSFPVDFTLYYTPGTTGWTDSEYYDADAGTWNGYKLEVWDTSEIDEDTPRLVVQPVTGRPGDTVEVKINVENNPGLVGIATMVTFDSDILEYVSCEISSEFGGVNNSHLNGNTLKTIWVTGDEAVTVNDTFLTITFKINEDAEDGDTYITLDYDYDNTLDANEECIEFATFGDYVTVFSGILGDVNNSGTVTSLDVRWILQYLSGAREFSEDQLALADVNSSGTVTSLDVRWILQYLSGARDENYQAK